MVVETDMTIVTVETIGMTAAVVDRNYSRNNDRRNSSQDRYRHEDSRDKSKENECIICKTSSHTTNDCFLLKKALNVFLGGNEQKDHAENMQRSETDYNQYSN